MEHLLYTCANLTSEPVFPDVDSGKEVPLKGQTWDNKTAELMVLPEAASSHSLMFDANKRQGKRDSCLI